MATKLLSLAHQGLQERIRTRIPRWATLRLLAQELFLLDPPQQVEQGLSLEVLMEVLYRQKQRRKALFRRRRIRLPKTLLQQQQLHHLLRQ